MRPIRLCQPEEQFLLGMQSLAMTVPTGISWEEAGKIAHLLVFPWKRFICIHKRLASASSPLQVTSICLEKFVHTFAPQLLWLLPEAWDPDLLAVKAKGASTHEFQKTIAKKHSLTGSTPQGSAHREETKSPVFQSFPEIGLTLYFKSCCLHSGLLI